ncbi:hypothetical protein QTP88_009720 [Uroleucon formosanum]
MLCEVYGEECLSRARVFDWYKQFCSGREDVEDDDRSGRPTTSSTNENVEKIDKIIRQYRRLSFRAVAEMVNIDRESAHNAPAYSAFSIQRFLTEKNISILQHPPYSPDLAPCNFFLFPKIKSLLKGIHFQTVDDVKMKTAELLKGLTKSDWQYCFQEWQRRMQQCVVTEGR